MSGRRRDRRWLFLSRSTPSSALTMSPAAAAQDGFLPFPWNGDWYDGGGEGGGGSSVAPPAPLLVAVVAGRDDSGETAAAPLFGVPGADSQRNGTAPARRL